MNKKTIIVTGGLGTIGLALSKSLLKQGHIVIAVDTKKNKNTNNNDNFFIFKIDLNKRME